MNTGTLEDAALQVRASSSVNGTGTCEKSGTRLTQRRSRRVRKYPATPEQRGLIALRVKHGAKTAAGQRYSNLAEMFGNLPPEGIDYLTCDTAVEVRKNLLKSMREQMDDLTRLTGA